MYFKRFDEAEALYRAMDRLDLAIALRSRLGDWFKVRQGRGGSHASRCIMSCPLRACVSTTACRLTLASPSLPLPSATTHTQVEKLVGESGGDDAALTNAWTRIGAYYADRQKWAKAAQFYTRVSGGAGGSCHSPVTITQPVPWKQCDTSPPTVLTCCCCCCGAGAAINRHARRRCWWSASISWRTLLHSRA